MDQYVVELTRQEWKELSELASKGKAATGKITHAQVLLRSDSSADGPSWTDKQISEALGVHTNTIHGIRRHFVEHRLGGL